MKSLHCIAMIALSCTLAACGGSDKKPSDTQASPGVPSTSSASVLYASSTPSSSITQASSNRSSSSMSISGVNTSSSASVDNAGIFDVDYGGFSGVYTFLENNDFYGLHFIAGGLTLAGHPHGTLTTDNSVANKEHIAWANFIDAADGFGFQESNGMFGRTFTAQGVNVSITGLGAAPGMIFNATAKKQKSYSSTDSRSLYKDPLPLASIAGHYAGILRTVGISLPMENIANFSINSDGTFTVTAANCLFSGSLQQHQNTGVFDINATATGSTCSLANQLKGIATPLAVSDATLKLAIQLDDLNNSQSAVFIIER